MKRETRCIILKFLDVLIIRKAKITTNPTIKGGWLLHAVGLQVHKGHDVA